MDERLQALLAEFQASRDRTNDDADAGAGALSALADLRIDNHGDAGALRAAEKEAMKVRDVALKAKLAQTKRADVEKVLSKKLKAAVGNKNENVAALASKWADWQAGKRDE